jgi:hypothetical protein
VNCSILLLISQCVDHNCICARKIYSASQCAVIKAVSNDLMLPIVRQTVVHKRILLNNDFGTYYTSRKLRLSGSFFGGGMK